MNKISLICKDFFFFSFLFVGLPLFMLCCVNSSYHGAMFYLALTFLAASSSRLIYLYAMFDEDHYLKGIKINEALMIKNQIQSIERTYSYTIRHPDVDSCFDKCQKLNIALSVYYSEILFGMLEKDSSDLLSCIELDDVVRLAKKSIDRIKLVRKTCLEHQLYNWNADIKSFCLRLLSEIKKNVELLEKINTLSKGSEEYALIENKIQLETQLKQNLSHEA